ncbi:MAG TPA: hypothetical protein PLL23_14455 [Chitinophagaceae bacterium]|nr:hypothetical protein [Chitinophagaceae bacterium]
MSEYEKFQARYEQEGDQLFLQFNKFTENQLLDIISSYPDNAYGLWKGGDQYQIWRALGDKGTKKSIEPLFAIVTNLEIDYLVRYHACDALFHIAVLKDDNLKGIVQYGLDIDRQPANQQAAFRELEKLLGLSSL